jgi:hypothetical protein
MALGATAIVAAPILWLLRPGALSADEVRLSA